MKVAPASKGQNTMIIYVRQGLFLKRDEIPVKLLNDIATTLTLENPAYEKAERAGRWTGYIDKYLTYYDVRANDKGEKFLVLPRGWLPSLLKVCKKYQIRWTLRDYTLTCEPVSFNSQIQLRDYQLPAVEAAIDRGGGVIVSPAGSGKTVMGMEIIARLGQPTLWVTHTKELLYQAIDRAVEFLQIPKDDIGIMGDGKRTIGDRLTVGLVQTLVKGIADELKNGVGTVILDESHHCPASSFLDVVSQFPAKYRFGLTATPFRKDGLTKPMYWTLGYTAYEVVTNTLMDRGKVIRPDIQFVPTDFHYHYSGDDYAEMVTALTEDKERNELILETLLPEATEGHFCMVLSERVAHCYALQEMLSVAVPDVTAEVLVGNVPKKKRQEIVESLRNKEIQVIFATNPLAEEGLDLPHLDRLFLTCPSRNKRKVIQAVGRIMRPCDGKKDAIVFDFQDSEVGILESQGESRKRMYEELR
jgi:superfamily II DNA or RNA helicase